MTPLQIPIHQTPDLSSLDFLRFEQDWFGESTPFNPGFKFGLSQERLWFGFEVDKEASCLDLEPGEFRAGLWEQDVAEFFLMGADGAYQEFNVSPVGAWWSGHFRGYRDLVSECHSLSVSVSATAGSAGWECQFSVPVEELSVRWGPGVMLNPCSILSPHFFCYGHRDGGEPDFHLASNFCPVLL